MPRAEVGSEAGGLHVGIDARWRAAAGAARMLGIGFCASAGQAREAGALLSNMPEHIRAEVPDAIRPALDMRSESVGLCRLPPCIVSGREPVALQPRCEACPRPSQ